MNSHSFKTKKIIEKTNPVEKKTIEKICIEAPIENQIKIQLKTKKVPDQKMYFPTNHDSIILAQNKVPIPRIVISHLAKQVSSPLMKNKPDQRSIRKKRQGATQCNTNHSFKMKKITD